jgi:hypothetical protein
LSFVCCPAARETSTRPTASAIQAAITIQ